MVKHSRYKTKTRCDSKKIRYTIVMSLSYRINRYCVICYNLQVNYIYSARQCTQYWWMVYCLTFQQWVPYS